jgi:uncharacterized membrane protein
MRRQSVEIVVSLVCLSFGGWTGAGCDVARSPSVPGDAEASDESDLTGRSRLAGGSQMPLAPLGPPLAAARHHARGMFHDLGELPGCVVAGGANDVSADGDVVVGCSESDGGELAYRWTPETGAQALSGQSACAHAVSPDGHLVAGAIADPVWQTGRAAVLWHDRLPAQHLYTPVVPGGDTPMWFNVAYAVIDSGAVFGYGTQQNAYGDWIGLRAQNGTLSSARTSVVYAASTDGALLAGAALPGHGFPLHYATLNSTNLGYPQETFCLTPALRDCTSTARDLSADGSVVVGEAFGPPPGQTTGGITLAFVWTAAEGMHWLPDIHGGTGASAAYGINGLATGVAKSVIVGYATDGVRQRAAVWIGGSAHTVESLLGAHGVHVPRGWRLEIATAASADGRVLVGAGTRPDGRKAGWRAVLAALR